MTKQEAAQKLAELQLNKDALESEKKAVASDYTEKIKKIESEMSALARMYLSEENKDQQDMFDGIEEAEHTEIITDESKLLNSGLELPENVDPEEVEKIEQRFTQEKVLKEIFDFDEAKDLYNNTDTHAYVIIENKTDLEYMGIGDYDSEQLENWKGKLLIHFESEPKLQSFIHNHLLSQKRSYERFGKYILIPPVNVEADND